ncbi:hypothetical protein [Burkholderia thailandensis]|uniref:hypothetical protein n=1 Tax=Burkholderia thailandensis TaxID=57975 RepID=UPI0020A58CCB|nr:hypothetical protein [Burkholderia thailandensis]
MCALFQMIAGAGVGMMQARLQNAQNDAQYTLDSAKTEAANMLSKDSADNNNMIREAGNAFLAAQAALSNTPALDWQPESCYRHRLADERAGREHGTGSGGDDAR